mgnify:CR=1 FL=1
MKRVGRSFTKSKGISYNKKEKTIVISGKYHRHTAVICEIADLLSEEKE